MFSALLVCDLKCCHCRNSVLTVMSTTKPGSQTLGAAARPPPERPRGDAGASGGDLRLQLQRRRDGETQPRLRRVTHGTTSGSTQWAPLSTRRRDHAEDRDSDAGCLRTPGLTAEPRERCVHTSVSRKCFRGWSPLNAETPPAPVQEGTSRVRRNS